MIIDGSRKAKKLILVGGVEIGGATIPKIQSMCNTDTADAGATLAQIQALADKGCEIIRVAVPSKSTLDSFEKICSASPLPVVADIHFDHTLAIEAAKRGAAKLRINPGNIGSFERVGEIIEAAKAARIPIRIGVNAGSLSPDYDELDLPLAEKLAKSALSFAEHFESRDYFDIVLSAKASSVPVTIQAYKMLDELSNYPLHIGVTEAGTLQSGSIKSAVGLGYLLTEGIGDTLRVSLTADPLHEIDIAYEILGALDIRRNKPELVSCPTCGRTQIDLIPMAEEVQRRLADAPANLKIAVMGCVVNGPGEAREADFGIAAGRGVGVVFAKGEPLFRVEEDKLVDALFEEIAKHEQGV